MSRIEIDRSDIQKEHSIDRILYSFEQDEPKDDHVETFIQAIIAEMENRFAAYTDDIFDTSLDKEAQHFAAVCLLRLLSTSDKCFDDRSLRVKSFALFDRTLSDLYKILGVSPRSQTYEKRAALQTIARKTEDDIMNKINSFTSLNQLNNFRAEFMQTLRNQRNRVILQPFLPSYLTKDSCIGELFESLKKYAESKGLDQIYAHKKAKSVLEEYGTKAKAYGTEYSTKFLAGLSYHLLGLLSDHFKNSDLFNLVQTDVRPIILMDRILLAIKNDRARNDLVDFLLQTIVEAVGEKYGIHVENLFDQGLNTEAQRFIAICLLRLLSACDECFNNRSLRVESFSLFDRTLEGNLYKALNINSKLQTYEKRAVLQTIVKQVEEDIMNKIESFTSLSQLGNFRAEFMQTLKNQRSRIILQPFLPRALTEGSRLGELFSSIEEYEAAKGIEQIRTYGKANEVLKEYLSEAKAFGTEYSQSYLARLAKRLLDLLTSHFQKSELSRPANVEVNKTEKKYPFHLGNTILNLRIVIRNIGPGQGFDVNIKITSRNKGIIVQRPAIFLGDLGPEELIEAQVPIKIESPIKTLELNVAAIWTSFDTKERSAKSILCFEAQKSDVDWAALDIEEPYSLEPVETEDKLVGRKEILNRLFQMTQIKNITSSYIYGQKRVGKTSVVRVLRDRVLREQPDKFVIVYLQAGDYVDPDPLITIERLGRRICYAVQDNLGITLEIPQFSGALAPLSEFLDRSTKLVKDMKFLFILDEFDELPISLYQRGPVGDAFFLTLRSISSKPQFGFILVGGETMARIMQLQGDRLNKFRAMRIDYFDREQHWNDFEALIKKPVTHWFEITDKALTTIYEESAGNPYFAKLIAGELFDLMVKRRDCHVTKEEVQEAVRFTLNNTSSNSFEHFWRDDILATGDKAEDVTVGRRRVLLSIADVYRRHGKVQASNIFKQDYVRDMRPSEVQRELRDLQQRKVIVEKGGCIECQVPLFGKWLVEKGIQEIITSFDEPDAILKRKKREEENFVRPEEIVSVCNMWHLYRGRKITEDTVRTWLQQFGNNYNQRLMFTILQNLNYYGSDRIRTKLKEAHGVVKRGITMRIDSGRRRRSDILISYLDKIGKSGANYAKLYADENQIYVDKVVEKNKIYSALYDSVDLQALVFIDDIIGTGNSAIEYLSQLMSESGEIIKKKKLKVVFIAICGFVKAQAEIQRRFNELPVSVHICDALDESSQCFNDNSSIFPEPTSRQAAKDIAFEKGLLLEKRFPVGYGHCQATVVFEHSCPNNTLPILWSSAKGWFPLFPRH